MTPVQLRMPIRVVSGLAATAALAALVAGSPVLLYRLSGSPLPGRVGGWHQVMTALARPDDGALALAVVRDGTWLAWLLFTVCVVAEAVALIRGRRAPWLRLGGMQGAAARLVALAALTVSASATTTLSASASTVAGQHISQLQASPAQSGTRSVTGAAGIMSRTDALVVTVRSGDCLWTIAQRYLGAGDLYPEIARLNYGRPMGDGQVFTNPALIMPGWQLLLPAGASTAGAGQHTAPATASQHSGHATPDVHYQRRHPAARSVAATVAEPAIEPGLGSSAGAGSSSGVGPSSGAGSSAAGSADHPAAAQPRNARDEGSSARGDSADHPAPGAAGSREEQVPQAAIFVTGALAGAILTGITRLRFRQRQWRRRGRRIALPASTEVLAAEQRLRAAASVKPVQTLREALAVLEAGVLAGGELPDIVGVHVARDLLEILLAVPAIEAPPAPYEVSPGRQGMCWQLALPAVGAPTTDLAASHVLPGLVTAGWTGDGCLLLDLESLQVTGCDGPPALVDQVVSTVATELVAGQWSGWYDLLLVGCDELAPLERAVHCETVDEALSILAARCARTTQRLLARAPADVRELRLVEPEDEDWGLVLLVSRVEPSPDQLTRLLDLAVDGPGGVAALIAGDPQTAVGRTAPTALQLAPDLDTGAIVANVVPLQITVRPCALSEAEYAAVGTLFSTAADLRDVSQDEEPYTAYGAAPWIPQAATWRPDAVAVDLLQPDRPALDDDDGQDQPPADVEPVSGEPDGPEFSGDERAAAGFTVSVQGAEPDRPETGDEPTEAGFTVSVQGAQPDGPESSGDERAAAGLTVSIQGVQPDGPESSGDERAAAGLTVSVLGPLAISGAAGPLQPKQAELVLALALAAPAGLSNSALCAMLGADPDHPKPTDALRQLIARTRRRLGVATDGAEYILHTGSGRYVMHMDVSLDWSLFRRLVASGRTDDLRSASQLVRGEPFTGSYFWWIDVPLIESVRAEVVDAAERLAEIELAAGSPRAAARAARAGLLADSSAEQLWRAVMRAEHAVGNLAGVTEAWRRCLDAIEDVAPGGEPHPDTSALYRRLARAVPEPASAR